MGSTHGQAATDQLESRHIALRRGTRIPSIILPDDEFVIVERDRTGSFITLAPLVTVRDEDLDQRAGDADVIAVGEVINSESLLVDDDTWIETNVTIVARQLIKDTKPSALQPDKSLTFNHYGGDLHIGRARVRADHYHLFKIGERYLLFLRRTGRDRNVVFGLLEFPFRITDDERLAPMMMSAGQLMTAPSPLFGMSLKTAISELSSRIRPQ